MLNMSKILMVGSGPVAIQLARLCHLHGEHIVDMVSRVHASTKSKRVFDAYQRDGFFSVMTQNDAHQCFSGKFTVRHFFKDVKDITEYYDVVILACSSNRLNYQSTIIIFTRHAWYMYDSLFISINMFVWYGRKIKICTLIVRIRKRID